MAKIRVTTERGSVNIDEKNFAIHDAEGHGYYHNTGKTTHPFTIFKDFGPDVAVSVNHYRRTVSIHFNPNDFYEIAGRFDYGAVLVSPNDKDLIVKLEKTQGIILKSDKGVVIASN